MFSLGFIAFLSPWHLLALIILPILWQIVRFTPPAPKHIEFPAIRLLKFLKQQEDTPRRAPWWLLLLRIILIVLVILGASHPVLNPEQQLTTRNSILLVIDNSWSAARNWNSTGQQIQQILDVAQRENKPVQIITTAPNPDSKFGFATDYLAAAEAQQIVKGLRPLPWAARYDLAMRDVSAKKLVPNPDIFWFSGGLMSENFYELMDKLSSAGRVHFILRGDQPIYMLSADPWAVGGIDLVARRTLPFESALMPANILVQAFDEDGRAMGQKEISFEKDKNTAKAKLDLPLDVKNKISRVVLTEQVNAATTYLMDEMGRQHPVGIVTTQAMDSSKPLLDDLYFIERAITPFADIIHGDIDEVLKANVAAIILTDANNPTDTEAVQLEDWVKKGGLLIRFAGDNLQSNTKLLPVPIHDKPRNLSGNLSWSEPLALAPMPEIGPFAGLQVPGDIKVNKQLLTTPTPDLAGKTWASLQDGTPLVTGDKLGDGQLAFFHVAANHNWSNLILSGLFVEMLQRLIWSSQGIIAQGNEGGLNLHQMLDGFGQLQAPPSYVKTIQAEELITRRASPILPPGYYGTDTDKKAFNLSDHTAAMEPVTALPKDVELMSDLKSREKDVRPILYLLAALLALIDMIIGLNIRGLLPGLQRSWISAIALGILFASSPAMADQTAMEAAKHLRLAYIKTYVQEIDRVSEAGLAGLSRVLRSRTAVEAEGPIGLDPDKDELAFYPLLYWPVAPNAPILSPTATYRINNYLHNGGMIVIDTRDGNGASISQNILANYFQNIDIPILNTIDKNHVLLRSFYLLKEWPGRWNDKTLWLVDSESSYFDGVSPVIVGTEDWAAAWAVDKTGKPMFPVVPGGEQQREMARRFGVNLVMYALTGNYKSDQVHVPAILERLGNEP
ncbi:MAG: DUF4159 domain-containing protein [Alphaproteobacteria bacterium]|nr:MAG: DUF4159 domain-containing protein [Alphaproteobacteria bacterium]